MTKTALILIDIQNDYFPGGRCEVHKMEAAAANAAKLLDHARKNDDFIVHVRHEVPGDNPPFLETGTSGAAIHSSVLPQADEHVILKHKPNSFMDTPLKALLDMQGVTQVVICGAMSQMCVDATTRAASDFGYNTVVIHDACAAREQVFNAVVAPADHVHAAIMAALERGYARLDSTVAYLGG